MSTKAREKSKVEIIDFEKILGLHPSFRDYFTKKNKQHCLEIYYENDQILFLACYDGDQMKQWQQYLKKAMAFYEWFHGLKCFIEKDKDRLTAQVSFKINEIIQFVEQFNSIQQIEVPFIE